MNLKKTIAVIGSAAALSFAGAGLAAAQPDLPDAGSLGAIATGTPATEAPETDGPDASDDADDVETPAEVSEIATQLCGSISAYDFLGSAGSVVPGLTGDECETNADAAVAAAMTGDITGALDILRGIDAETPGDGEAGEGVDTGSAGSIDGLSGDADADTDTDTGA